jgi:hypothetical protein
MTDEKAEYSESKDYRQRESALAPLQTEGDAEGDRGVSERIETPSASERASESRGERESLYQRILASVSSSSATQGDENDVDDDAKKIAQKQDADSQSRQLADLAMVKGVAHAVKVARRVGDFYVLDQMHDDLANRLYENLKQKGLIRG